MNSVLLWVGGLLVAVLALLFAVPYVVDWNSYRGVFEEEASRLLGRDVRVGGRVDLRLLPRPFVRFEKVRIADVGAMQGEPFFRAESFTLWLSLPPLLRGAIEANDVELDRPTLSLAVDERGIGNWKSLQISPGALPFVPSDVALQAVRINDGTVMLRDLASRSSLTLTKIDGELSAPALNGPFRFRGDLLAGGERHEVRLNTSTVEADGKLRLKSTVRTLESQNSFALDGQISEPAGRLRLEGALTAKLPLAPAGLPGTAAASGAAGRGAAAAVFELKAQLGADSAGIKLSDLTLGFEQDGRPQLLSGSLATSWGEGRTTAVDLTSRWLDLDRIAGGGGQPLGAVRDFAARLAALMPGDGTSRAAIAIEQVNLGGEAVSAVNLALVRRGGVLELEELSGLVPGNGRLAVQGRFGAAQGKAPPPFEGALSVRGASFSRMLAWAFPGQALVAPGKADTAFALAGSLSLSAERVGISQATLELPQSRLTGGIVQQSGKDAELAITLDGDTIDLALLAPELIRLEAWQRLLAGEGAKGDGEPGLLERHANGGMLRLDVRAGRLVDGTAVLHDVAATIATGRGRLEIPGLRLRTGEGLAIDLTAALDSTGGRRHGTLSGWATAPGREAAAQLAQQLEALLPSSRLALPADSIAHLAPMEFGFKATLARAPGQRITVVGDGTAAGSRTSGTVVLDGGMEGWRKAGVDIRAEVDSPNLVDFMRRVHGRAAGRGAAEGSAPGKLTIRIAGPSAEAMAALADIDSGAVKATFRGRARAPEGAPGTDVDGELTLSTRDVAAAIEIIEPDIPVRPRGLAAQGTLGIARAGNVVRLMPRRLDVGGAQVAGEISHATEAGLSRVGGRLAMARASVLELAGPVLDQQRGRDRSEDGGLPSVWPDAAFDFSGLDGVAGQVVLTFGRLEIADGLALADATMDVEFGAGRISVPRLQGVGLSGAFTGRVLLEKAPGGAALQVAGRLGPLPLAAAMGPVAGKQAQGEATLEFDARGRGGSVRALASALAGSGTAAIANGRIPGLGPAAIDAVADQSVAGAAAASRQDMIAAVRRALTGSELAAGNKRVAIEISDGAARVAPFEIAIEGGRASNTTTVDLLGLKADSEWVLTSTRRRAGTGGSGELPGVSLVYVGPLKDVLASEPRVGVDALERELAVRRMERDVDKLEEMRRQDEDRTKRDRELREGTGGGTGAGSNVDGAPVIEAPLPIPGEKAEVPAARPANGAGKRAPATETARPKLRSLEEILQRSE